MQVIESGPADGIPVVLIHGNLSSGRFYEHLFDEQWMRPLVPQWLSPHVVENIYPLWQQMLAPDALAEVDRLFKR